MTSGTKPKFAAVCIVRQAYFPAELNVKREAETLSENGYKVHVVCLRRAGELASEIVNGVHVHRLPLTHKRGSIIRYLVEYNSFFALVMLEMIRLKTLYPLQVVQINTMPDYLVFASFPLKLLGVKVLLHMHEPMPELFRVLFAKSRYRPLVWAIRFAERCSLAYADHVLTVTEEMRANFAQRGADLNKITVMLNVPDDRVFRPPCFPELVRRVKQAKQNDRETGAFRLVCHGTIEQRYGLDLVVAAIAEVREVIPGVQFRFMGMGDFLPSVLADAKKLKVESSVHYLGHLPFESMIEEILCADVTVVPMRKNAYSDLVHTNKMYEYIALARPVIASRLASVVKYFPEDTLLYFEPDNYTDLAAQLVYAFENPEDMQMRVRRTTSVYESYQWNREKQKYLEVYSDLSRN